MAHLLLALHGSRHPGVRGVGDDLRHSVAARLPGVTVQVGYVDLMAPHVATVLAEAPDSVVVPVFLTAGYHVATDLPDAVSSAGGTATITGHVGPHLLDAVTSRLAEAGGPGDGVLLAAAGSAREGSVAEVEAAARLLEGRLGVPVRAGFVYAASPSVETAFARLVADGRVDVSVAPYAIAPGLFLERLRALGAARVSEPIGVHRVLVDAVVAEYRASFRTTEVPAYLSGLDLAGRRVLVAGAGKVATRRIAALLAAGADVVAVAPTGSDTVAGWASEGRLAWVRRPVSAADVSGAWYVIAATDDAATNELVARTAEAQRTFCVRADAADAGTARTPAVGHVGGLAVGVVGRRDPRRSAAARHVAVAAVAAWSADGEPDRRQRAGTVLLVGGGPGDPDLLTVGGLRAVREADVVIFDRLAPLAVLDETRPGALLLDVGKEPRGPQTPQERINELLVEHARAGRRVVRLKGGDPFVFGRGGEEALACAAAGVEVRVLPGVTSSVAAPALAGIPVTHRTLSQGFTVVSGHVPPGDPRSTLDWEALARGGTTIVMLMGVTHLRAVADALAAAGLPASTPAAVVERAGDPAMRVVRGTLGSVADLADAADIRPPAITVIGDVAALDLTADPGSPADAGGGGAASARWAGLHGCESAADGRPLLDVASSVGGQGEPAPRFDPALVVPRRPVRTSAR